MSIYSVNTFLSIPNETDIRLKIYDKYSNLRYTVDPNISYFYKNGNIAVISIEGDNNNINLDFPTSNECSLALTKLNDYKQILLSNIVTSPTAVLGKTSDVFSKSNLNMLAKLTDNTNNLACDVVIIDVPLKHSCVRVFINGVEVNVGGKLYPFDCYFSNNGGLSVRINGDERTGDKLYWNSSVSGYELDETDLIDFVYLTKINI